MKTRWFNFKLSIYYIIGLISFSVIAYITQTILISILLKTVINPLQDIYNFAHIIFSFFPYYISIYTILHFLILYSIRKYDRYIVNKLNEKLEKVKGVDENGKR